MANGKRITERLLERYPDPKLALRFSNPLELLIAIILSAQCTDARVNEVTRGLFRRYRRPEDYVSADPGELEQALRPTGYYRSKTQKVRDCCRMLAEEFGGRVPDDVEQLTRLPGVGRKTANMLLGNAFGQQAIAVDTHVLRVSNRLGLVDTKNADKAEQALMAQIPQDKWTAFTNAMILHGRETCTARSPRCGACVLYAECEWPEKDKSRA